MADFLALMGPSGVGKTHLGRRLAKDHPCQFVELEPELVRCFGTGVDFEQKKGEALEFIESSLRDRRAHAEGLLVFESTGLSDAGILERLSEDFDVLLVRVDAEAETCARRVQSREPRRNLDNDPKHARSFSEYWHREVGPKYRFDLTVRNEAGQDREALTAIVRFLGWEPAC